MNQACGCVEEGKHLYEGCYMSLANAALSHIVTLGRVIIEVLHVHHDHVHHVGDV